MVLAQGCRQRHNRYTHSPSDTHCARLPASLCHLSSLLSFCQFFFFQTGETSAHAQTEIHKHNKVCGITMHKSRSWEPMRRKRLCRQLSTVLITYKCHRPVIGVGVGGDGVLSWVPVTPAGPAMSTHSQLSPGTDVTVSHDNLMVKFFNFVSVFTLFTSLIPQNISDHLLPLYK